jgi:hypothetical protein
MPPGKGLHDDSERRETQRVRILKAGKIIKSGGWGSIECIIKDVSSTGAKIEVDPLFEFPSKFSLLIIKDETLVECELAWRNGRKAGVRFTSEMKQVQLRDYRF